MARSDYVINLYAYTLNRTAQEAMAELADHGFEAFELMMYPGHLWMPDMDAGARAALRKFIASRNLHIQSVNQPNIDINIAAAAPEMREHSIRMMARMVECAGEFGARQVLIGPGKVNPLMPMPRDQLIGHFYRALDQLVPLAQKAGTQVLVENMPFAFLPDAEGLLTVVEGYGSDDVGILYDLANGAFIKEDIRAALKRCGDRLKLVHLSDTGTKVYKHDPVGHGTMDFGALIEDLAAIGWTERPVLEIIGVSEQPSAEILDSIRRLEEVGWANRFAA
ncbi:sugar phosphate isomerase/epimerase [Ancylobacter aquaticus]|uniref:Sugar phosphate isomerase/epimerase n=1 Tax=Ancylobacter aquaticus TaxID=100 RepID=A0A4R1I6T8_ANCAQ|nr:sugar phosphate isomerase/epimerase family protein [Ancylobacter aquaticus]TCK29210.1 sugar phosphate isomerase/epimerase [Ancylobacter aquaticus]